MKMGTKQYSSVYLYEPHWLVQQVLAARLKLIPGLELVGMTGDAQQALADLRRLRPRLLVAAVDGRRGLDPQLLDWVRRTDGLQIIVLDVHWDAQRAAAVQQLPDSHYILKKLPWTALAAKVADVVQRAKTSPGRAPKKYEFRDEPSQRSDRKGEWKPPHRRAESGLGHR